MNTDTQAMQKITAHHDMMELFDELPFFERVRRVMDGLREPSHTGEYKYARLQLLRLSAPIAAVVVPIILVGLLLLLPPLRGAAPVIHVADIHNEPPPDELDKIDPVEKVEVPTMEPDPVPIPNPDIRDIQKPNAGTPFQGPAPTPDSGIAKTLSPIRFRNLPPGKEPGGKGPLGKIPGTPPGADGAVRRALRWLRDVQASDGSWSTASGETGGNRGTAQPAMTGLALLTFLGYGETPASAQFGHCVENGLAWLVDHQDADGRFQGRDKHDYSHPIATYALCEAYGLTRHSLVKEAAERALSVIVNGQNARGLWNYNCEPGKRSDLSYSGWCIQAIKAAHIAGLGGEPVRTALKRAAVGLPSLSHTSGGFGYTGPGQHNLTCAGVLSMQLVGEADAPVTRSSLAWLSSRATCDWQQPWGKNPVYYWYYTTQALFHAGGSEWDRWNRRFGTEFVTAQTVLKGAGSGGKDIGYWAPCTPSEHSQSRVYTTALCALSLEVYYKFGSLLTFKDLDTMRHEDVKRLEGEPIDITIKI
jgi:hypothetical protein